MPPCEPLTTTAPAASDPIRVMLSAVRIGGDSGIALSRAWATRSSCREIWTQNKLVLSLCRSFPFSAVRQTSGRNHLVCAAAKRFSLIDQPVRNAPDTPLRDRQRKSESSPDILRSALRAGGLSAFSRLLPVKLALLLAPGRPLWRVERAVVIGVDLVKALAVK